MLVLSRRAGETVVLSDGVTFKVEEIHKSRVKISIQAPGTIKIRRGELPERKPENSFVDHQGTIG